MNNYSRFLKKFLFVGLLAVFGVMNGYGQADDCICIQNDDADFLVQGCEPYDFTKDYSSGSKNDILCISNGGANQVDLNKLGAGDVLHIIATDKTIEFTTNRGNHAAKIYIHEKVKVHVLANGIQGVSVYNRGTMTTAGELEMNGELLNVGSLTVNGKLGNLNHRFSNYGNVVVNGQLGQIQGDIFCVGSNSVTTVNTIGDFNSSENKAISTTGDGGYINVKNGFGNFNEKVTSSTNLHIRLAPGVTPTIDPDDPRWGTADVEYGLYEGCNFIPIITPNTFIPGTPTLFTAGYLVDGVEAIDPKFQWMINDTPIEGATSATYTATLEADDKISCAVSNGDGTCLKPSNGVSLSAAEYDPVANITVSFPEGVTVTNHEIDLCNLSLNTGEKITFEVKSEFTGLSPKYQWYVGSTLQPGETGKTFVYDPAELTPGSPVEIYCEVTADFPCADPINPRPFIKVYANETPTASLSNPVFCEGSIEDSNKPDTTLSGHRIIWYEESSPPITDWNLLEAKTHIYYYKVAHASVASCQSDVHEYIVTVDTIPEIYTDLTGIICSGKLFSVAPVDKAGDGEGNENVIPSRTEYTWQYNPAKSDSWIKGLGGIIPPNSTGRHSTISGHLENTDNKPGKVTYTVTPVNSTLPNNVADCEGNTFEVTITVNPVPKITNDGSLNRVICSGSAFTVTTAEIQAIDGNIVPDDTKYDWVINAVNPNIGNASSAIGQSSISQVLTNSTNTPQDVTYVVTPKFTNSGVTCGDGSNSFEIKVTVNPVPDITNDGSLNRVICSGSAFTVTTAEIQAIDGNIVPDNTKYDWVLKADNPNIGNASSAIGQSSISQVLTNSTNTPQDVTYVVTPKFTNSGVTCGDGSNSFEIKVTVNPVPDITNDGSLNRVICSGSAFTVTTAEIQAIGGNIVPDDTKYDWVINAVNPNVGNASSAIGQSSISQVLTNSTNTPQSVIYVVTPKFTNNGVTCGDGSNSFEITVTVNPVPKITNNGSLNRVICSGSAFTVTTANIQAIGGNIVPADTKYDWVIKAANPNIGGATNATAQSSISQVLTNSTNTPQDVTYVVTPKFTNSGVTCGDGSNSFEITVTVNPVPNVTNDGSLNRVICSGSAFTVTTAEIQAIDGNIVPDDTKYDWVIKAVNPNVGNASSAIGQSSISQVLTNSTNTPQSVTYVVTPKFTNNGVTCGNGSNSFEITVTVIPIPNITNTRKEFDVCSGLAWAGATLTTNVSGTSTTYHWKSYASGGVTGNTPESSGNLPKDILSLPEGATATGSVIYRVLPKSSIAQCSPVDSIDFTVTVKPLPQIKILPVPSVACSDYDTITITTDPGMSQYDWGGEIQEADGATLHSGNGTNQIKISWVNTTGVIDYKTVTVNYVAKNGCTAVGSASVAVPVHPEVPEPVFSTLECEPLTPGTAHITVTAPLNPPTPPALYEYSLNGGAFQSGVEFDVLNGIHTITVRNISNGCINSNKTPENTCGCEVPPTVAWSSNADPTCENNAIQNTVTYGGTATKVTITHTGAGSIALSAGSTSKDSIVTYTPAPADYGKTITVTATTDHPGDPCTSVSDTWSVYVKPFSTAGNIDITEVSGTICNESDAHIKVTAINVKNTVIFRLYGYEDESHNGENNLIDEKSIEGTETQYTFEFKPQLPTTNLIKTTYDFWVSVEGVDYCEGEKIKVPITVRPNATDGNIKVTAKTDTICDGGTASFTVEADGDITGASFTWYNEDNTVAGYGPSFTSDVLHSSTSPVAPKEYKFYVSVEGDNYCAGTFKKELTVVVKPNVQASDLILTDVSDKQLCENDRATLTASAPLVKDPVYTWYYNDEEKMRDELLGTNQTSLYQTDPLSAGTHRFYVTVSGSNYCTGSVKKPVQVTVNPYATDGQLEAEAEKDSICNGSTAKFTATAKGVINPVYRWYDAPLGGNKVADSGKLPTNTTHTYSPVLNVDATGKQTTYTFYVTVEGDNYCESAVRVPVSVKVNPYSTAANVILAVKDKIICDDSTAVFTASASGVTNPVYKWYNSSNLLVPEWTDENSKDPLDVSIYEIKLNATAPGTVYTYYVTVLGDNYCEGNNGAPVSVTVNPHSTPDDLDVKVDENTICDGQTAVFTATAKDYVTAPVYSWYRKDENGKFEFIQNGAVYAPVLFVDPLTPNQRKTYTFYVSILNDDYCEGDDKAPISVTVKPFAPAGILDVSQPDAICNGEQAAFTAKASGVLNPVFRWYADGHTQTPDPFEDKQATGGTSTFTPSLSVGDAKITYKFNVSVEGDNYCEGTYREPASITINPLPRFYDDSFDDLVHCAGETVKIDFEGKGINLGNIKWTNNNAKIGLPANGQGIIEFEAEDVENTEVATIIIYPVSAENCENPAAADTFTITVNPLPNFDANSIEDLTYCAGETTAATDFKGNHLDPGKVIWEITNYDETGDIGLGKGSGTGNIPSFKAAGVETKVVAEFKIIPVSDADVRACENPDGEKTFTITINPLPVITVDTKSETNSTCSGVDITVVTEKGMSNYEWTVESPGKITSCVGSDCAGADSINVQWTGFERDTTMRVWVNYSDENTCRASGPAEIEVTVFADVETPVLDHSVVCNDIPAGTKDIIVLSPLGNLYEYSLNGGAWQKEPVFAAMPNGAYQVVARKRNTNGYYCESAASDEMKYDTCGCETPPRVAWEREDETTLTCGVEPVKLDVTFSGTATTVTLSTGNGKGTISPEIVTVSPTTVTYTPSLDDTTKIIKIRALTDNPAGGGTNNEFCSPDSAFWMIQVNPYATANNFEDVSVEKDSICDENPVVFTAKTKGVINPVVRWYNKAGAMVHEETKGKITSTYTPNPALKAEGGVPTEYTFFVSVEGDNYCEGDYRDSISVTVKPYATEGNLKVETLTGSVCDGDSALFKATSVGVDNPVFTWYAVDGVTVVGKDSIFKPELRVIDDTLTVHTFYVSVQGDNYCEGNERDTVTAEVKPYAIESNLDVVAITDTICDGGSAKFEASAAGVENPVYTWYESVVDTVVYVGEVFEPVLSVKNDTLTVYEYYVSVQGNNVCEGNERDTVQARVKPYAAESNLDVIAVTDTICDGGSAKFEAAAVGIENPIYTWYEAEVDTVVYVGEVFEPVLNVKNDTLTVYEYYVSVQGDNVCEGNERDTVQARVKPYAAESNLDVIAVTDTICNGGSAKFEAAAVGIENPVYTWYEAEVDTVVYVGEVFEPVLNVKNDTLTVYEYYVSVQGDNVCEGNERDTVQARVKPYAAESNLDVVAVTDTICDGGSAQFEAAATGVENPVYTWYESVVDTVVYVGEVFEPVLNVKNDTLTVYEYYVSVQGDNVCEGNERDTVQAVVKPHAIESNLDVVAITDTICDGGSAQFEAAATGIENPVYTWYEAEVDTVVYVGKVFEPVLSIKNDTLTVYEYYVSVQGNNVCEGNERDTVQAIVKPYAAESNLDVIAVTDTICNGGSAKFEATATGIKNPVYTWYEAEVDTVVYVGEVFEPVLSVKNDTLTVYEYYVSVQGDNVCEGNERDTVRAIVKPYFNDLNKLEVTGAGEPICTGTSATLTATAEGVVKPVFRWYSSREEDADPISIGNIYVTPILTKDSTFYVSVSGGNYCENQHLRKPVTVKVRPLSDSLNIQLFAKADTICAGETAALTARATGVENPIFRWYKTKDATEWFKEGPDSTYITTGLKSDSTFYVSVSGDNYCEGTYRVAKTVKVMLLPSFPVDSLGKQVVCAGSPTEAIVFEFDGNLYVNPEKVKWTNNNTSIGLEASGVGMIDAFVTKLKDATKSDSATITVIPVSGFGCENKDAEATYTITVNPLPVWDKERLKDIITCAGEEVAPGKFTGTNLDGTKVEWKNSNPNIGLPASGTGNILPFTTRMITKQEHARIIATPVSEFGCKNLSTLDTFTITVNPPSPLPVTQEVNILWDSLPESIKKGVVATEYTIYWYTDTTIVDTTGLTVPPVQGFPAELDTLNTYTYWVKQVSRAGCPSPFKEVTVNVWYAYPPAVSDTVVCKDEPVDLNDLVKADDGYTLQWYTDNEEPKGTGKIEAPAVDTETPGVKKFYVSQKRNDPEPDRSPESDRSEITVTVFGVRMPDVSDNGPVYYCAGDLADALKIKEDSSGYYRFGGYTWSLNGQPLEVADGTTPRPDTNFDRDTLLVYEVKQFYVVNDDLTCYSDAPAVIEVQIGQSIELAIEATPGKIVREGTEVSLIVTSSNNDHGVFEWSRDGELFETTSGETLPLPNFYESGEYSVTATTSYNCSGSASVYLVAEVFIPNIITPYNRNSLNDKFMVGSRSIQRVEIFNRYQQRIYEGNDGWDGTFRGQFAEPGTYFYRVVMKDGNVRKGTVEVTKF